MSLESLLFSTMMHSHLAEFRPLCRQNGGGGYTVINCKAMLCILHLIFKLSLAKIC